MIKFCGVIKGKSEEKIFHINGWFPPEKLNTD
jgi:hypothetical protein